VTLALEPLGREHLPGVEALVADPEVLRYTRVPEPPPPDFAETWLRLYEDGRREGTRAGFAVVDGAGEFLGLALAPRIEPEARSAELGYIVAPSARGRGVATAALRLLTAWALAELDVLRLELRIVVSNHASKRVAERNGYRREGVLRSLHVEQDLFEDTEIWSRLRDDPEPEAANAERAAG
jgi:RimJ/RimL family protein N-acetyltransferase